MSTNPTDPDPGNLPTKPTPTPPGYPPPPGQPPDPGPVPADEPPMPTTLEAAQAEIRRLRQLQTEAHDLIARLKVNQK